MQTLQEHDQDFTIPQSFLATFTYSGMETLQANTQTQASFYSRL